MRQLFLKLFAAFDERVESRPPATESARRAPGTTPLRDAAALENTARELLRSIGCDSLAAAVRIVWNPRMRSTAGVANYAKNLITLNPALIPFGDDEINLTMRHELAHLLAKFRAGRRRIAPHGAEWKRACCDLGIPEEKRCHSLPLPRRQIRRKHLYFCANCRVEIRRVRPFRKRVACLSCCRAHNGGHYHERFRLVKIPGF